MIVSIAVHDTFNSVSSVNKGINYDSFDCYIYFINSVSSENKGIMIVSTAVHDTFNSVSSENKGINYDSFDCCSRHF